MPENYRYPERFEDFLDMFSTEQDCINYIAEVRWGQCVFICPKCGASGAYISQNYRCCKVCERKTSVTAGTVFHRSKKSLRLWFHVMWWMVSQKNGCSAMNLKNAMDFDSYETAWTWLHKLRKVMVDPNRKKLSGDIEVDEAYIGSSESDVSGRETETKILVAVAVEVKNQVMGRIRLCCIKDASSSELIPFIENSTEKGSNIITDGWSGYLSISSKGYSHIVHNISKSDKTATELLPNVHIVISLIKRWLLGTHQGSVFDKHMQAYLDEFVFRFNRRASASRGRLFYSLMKLAVSQKAITMDDLTGKKAFGDF
jgi:transposase-like protein